MVAAQLILINHFLMTLTKNSVDIPDISSKNSVVADSECPYGCTQCSPINGCLACKPPYHLLLLREGTMQTAHCTKACPKGFYRINRKKNGFCAKCTQRGCLECLNGHYCSLCGDGFKHRHGRCHSHSDTDDMGRVIFLEREERLLNNITMSTTPITKSSVPFTSKPSSSTTSLEQPAPSEQSPSSTRLEQSASIDTTAMNYVPETSTISAKLNTTNPVVESVTSANRSHAEESSNITSAVRAPSTVSSSSSNSTNKSCRKRVKSKRKFSIKGTLKNDDSHTESNENNKQSIIKQSKSKNRKKKRGRKCSTRHRRRKQKKKKDQSATTNNKFFNAKNQNISVSINSTSWLSNINDRINISKSSTLNSILSSKYGNKWKQHRMRHYPRHKRLKRLLQQRHLFEEAQKALQKQRLEKDNPQRSAAAASIAKRVRELRQLSLRERARRKKKKFLCLYRHRQRKWKTKRPHNDIYYGPGSVFHGLI